MPSIPPANDTDAEDVAWGLQTADALWKRGECSDAVVWLRRAAQAAMDADAPSRAVELGRIAAELSDWLAGTSGDGDEPDQTERVAVPAPMPVGPPVVVAHAAPPIRVPTSESSGEEAPPPTTPSVPPAEQVHAGMFNPWGDRPSERGSVVAPEPAPPPAPPAAPPPVPPAAPPPVPPAAPPPVPASPPAASRAPSGSMPVSSAPTTKPSGSIPVASSAPPRSVGSMTASGSIPAAAGTPSAGPAMATDDDGDDVLTSASVAGMLAVPPAPAAARVDASGAPAPPPQASRPSPPKPPPLPPRARPKPPVPAPRPSDVDVETSAPRMPVAPPPEESDAVPVEIDEEILESDVPRPSEEARAAEPSSEAVKAPRAPEPMREPEPSRPEPEPPRAREPEPSRPEPEPPPMREPEPSRPEPAPAPSAPAPAPSAPALDLEEVEAFADLPDDARAAFARAAKIDRLAESEEVSHFALAYVVEGEVDVAATVVDAPAMRLAKGAVLRSRGTTSEAVPMRLVATKAGALVATWSDDAVESAFKSCPWVEDDLRAAADRMLTLVGITIGPLGERLDASIREAIVARLTIRTLEPGEVVVTAGEPVPGLLLVGIGELELEKSEGVTAVVGSGEFLFPTEVLGAGAAPYTARAGSGGALVMFGDRHVAQELLVTCPPLLEVFAGM